MTNYSDDQIRDLLRAADVDRDALDQAEGVMLSQDQRILDLERCVAMLEAHNAELERDLGLARSDLSAHRVMLTKYMDHVGEAEGTDFLTIRSTKWTDTEWTILMRCRRGAQP